MSEVKIMKYEEDINPMLEKAIEDALSKMRRWIPGTIKGKNVSVRCFTSVQLFNYQKGWPAQSMKAERLAKSTVLYNKRYSNGLDEERLDSAVNRWGYMTGISVHNVLPCITLAGVYAAQGRHDMALDTLDKGISRYRESNRQTDRREIVHSVACIAPVEKKYSSKSENKEAARKFYECREISGIESYLSWLLDGEW